MHDFTQKIIAEFRAGSGQVGGPFDGARLLLLTTTGARSGRPHTTILGYYPDTAHRVLVVGSAYGAAKHPDWYHNLVANPVVTVETGLFTYQADAEILRGTDRDETFARLVEADPSWGEYQARTTRQIPIVALTAQPGVPGGASSFGEMLRLVHASLRRELRLIRKEVASAGGVGPGAQLRINCLTLCQGLHYHHTGESGGIFPAIAARHPELRPVIDRLDQEHDQIAKLLDRLQTVITTPQPVLPDVDDLITALNAHLDYEEAQLLPFL